MAALMQAITPRILAVILAVIAAGEMVEAATEVAEVVIDL